MVEFIAIIVMILIMAVPVISVIQETILMIISLLNASNRDDIKRRLELVPKLTRRYEKYKKRGWIIELILYMCCFGLEDFYLEFVAEVLPKAGWDVQLYNKQLHQPISSEHVWGVVIVVAFFLIGLVFLYKSNVNKVPPLLTCMAIGSLYLGTIYSLMWYVHIAGCLELFGVLYFLIPTLNTIMISIRLIVSKVYEFNVEPTRSSKIDDSKFLSRIESMRSRASYLPIGGLLCVIPLIGIMMLILLLFGQAPDAAIKAFTETSDFTLSTKVAPQNIQRDEHYLCTVAAGGHRRIVKPLRKGRRHGHEVIVNRQLQVANAFEEVLIDYTPGFHKVVRHIYDTYGFPIARLIKKQWVADVVYLIMKPLEILFLCVLYASCVHPEDRIAMQYIK